MASVHPIKLTPRNNQLSYYNHHGSGLSATVLLFIAPKDNC